MFIVFILVIQFATIVNAFIRCLRERFMLGVVGGLARGALFVTGVLGLVWSTFPAASPSMTAPPVMILAALLGPVVSFGVLFVAYLRIRNVPMAQEERLHPPFGAWLPVAIFDALYVVLAVIGIFIS